MKTWVGWKINSLQATKGHWAVFWELVAVSKGYFAAHLRNLSDRETTTRSWTDLLGLSWMTICRCSSIQCLLFGFTSNSLVAMPGDTRCAHCDRCSRPSHSSFPNESNRSPSGFELKTFLHIQGAQALLPANIFIWRKRWEKCRTAGFKISSGFALIAA